MLWCKWWRAYPFTFEKKVKVQYGKIERPTNCERLVYTLFIEADYIWGCKTFRSVWEKAISSGSISATWGEKAQNSTENVGKVTSYDDEHANFFQIEIFGVLCLLCKTKLTLCKAECSRGLKRLIVCLDCLGNLFIIAFHYITKKGIQAAASAACELDCAYYEIFSVTDDWKACSVF